MRLFGLLQLIVVALCYLERNSTLGGITNIVFYIATWVCWLLGAFSLNRAWKEGKIDHHTLMILSHSSLLFVANMSRV